MRWRQIRSGSILSGVLVTAMVMSFTVACSTGEDGEDASLSSFVERVVQDPDEQAFAAQYFSLERYRAGTDLSDGTDEPDVDHDGQLVVASCGVEEAGFVQQTVSRFPTGPLFN